MRTAAVKNTKQVVIESSPLQVVEPELLGAPPVIIAPPATDDPGTERDPDKDTDDEVNDLIDDLDAGSRQEAYIKFYRVVSAQEKPYIDKVLVSEYMAPDFGEAGLFRRFGGGKFELRIYGKKPGKTYNEMITRRIIDIEGAAKVRGIDHSPAILAATDNTSSLVVTMLQGQIAGQTELIKALLTRPEPARTALSETLEAFLTLKKLSPDEKPRTLRDSLEEFKLMRDLSGGGKGESDNNGWLERAFDKFLPTAMELMQQARTHKRPPLPVTVESPAALSTASPAPQSVMPTKESAMLQKALNYLTEQAKLDGDVEPIAKQFYNTAPDDVFDKVVNNPNWFEDLVKIHPAANAHRVWFTKLHDRVIALCVEAETAAGMADPESESDGLPESEKNGINGSADTPAVEQSKT